MKPEICEYPNKKFYEGKLRSSPICNNILEPSIKPYVLFNFKTENENVTDYINKEEISIINILLQNLCDSIRTNTYTIGVITPYKAQKDLLRESISSIK